MAFNVSGLGNYTNENADQLKVAMLWEPESIAYAEKQVGIKSAEKINLLATSPIFQAGGSCGFNASGDVTFTQRTLTVGKIKVNMELCPKDLEAKYTQKKLAKGSMYDTVAYEQDITADIVANIKKKLEVAFWQGDTSSVNADLNKFDGLLKIIDAASGVVSATASTINETNIRTILRDIRVKIPADVKGRDTVKVFCGYDTFETYLNKIAVDNLFHITGQTSGNTINIENSTLQLVAVHGLDGTNRIIAIETDNMFFGCDMLSEEETLKMWYSEDDDIVKFKTEFKAGAQIAFPSRIVKYANQ